MNNSTLKQLLNEYENKRSHAILIAEKKKEDFYSKNPRLQEQIENFVPSLYQRLNPFCKQIIKSF